MFIGHFGVAFAAKKIDQRTSLGTLFFAAQWLDLLWPVLLLTGTERVEIETASSAPVPLSFTHYPISHSLLMVTGWAILFGIVYYFIYKNNRSALLIGVLVISHWLLDFIVHIPDLPLTPFSDHRLGLGLWQYQYLALFIEFILLFTGVYIYTRATRAIKKTGTVAFIALIVFLSLIQVLNAIGPPPPGVTPVAIMGLSQWLLVAWAGWIDKNREAT